MSSDIKPGHRTTEFYLSLLAAIFGALLASGLFPAGGLGARITFQLSYLGP